jgi:hypothetical protein
MGAAMSAGDKAAVATWYKRGWNTWWLLRSITVTWTGTLRKARAAWSPPNPAPTITTRGRASDVSCGIAPVFAGLLFSSVRAALFGFFLMVVSSSAE